MAHNLTATQARNMSASDLVIYNEVDTITRAIYAASLAGDLSTQVTDGTTMTENTPTITVVGTSVGTGAVFTPNDTIIIAGTTVTLSSGAGSGTNVYQAVADINAASIVGLTASTDGAIVTLTYQCPQGTWSLALAEGNGTALADLGLTAGTTTATTPESVSYYNMWSGQIADRKKSYEFAQVVQNLQNDGFNIVAKQNTVSAQTTFMWEIYW
jgi:uncharacterized membrane protein